MTKLTRRGLFAVGAGGLATSACSSLQILNTGAPEYEGAVSFDHGVASGDPLSDRVVIWTRVTPADSGAASVPVSWGVSLNEDFSDPVAKGYVLTGADRDYTVKVDVEGLEPGSTYYYWFWVGQTASRSGRTNTLPASGLDDYKMAVVSCSNWPFGFFNAYREIAKQEDLDAVIHLGDYFYEYGVNGYGGNVGQQLGRNHEPAHETVTLADYRMRHAQYKSDPDLQAAHVAAPWFCTWDDHESTNNSYRTGAENHQPETEGDWTQRKAEAVQAYLEWMPVRDPVAGRAREAIYRKFEIGDLATLFLLESRLVGRSDEITYGEIGLAAEADQMAVAEQVKQRINDPSRTMLGMEQEQWLADGLAASTSSGKRWQVLGNQVTMAKVTNPDLRAGLNENVYDTLSAGTKRWYDSWKFGLEWNPDSWCGYPAARERLYAAARAANARIVTLTGDTHTAWANELHDAAGAKVGVEFGCTSVTSNGAGDSLPYKELNWLMAEANDEVIYYNAFDKGYTMLTLGAEQVTAEFVKVSTVRSPDYFASVDATFHCVATEAGMGSLTRPMSGGTVIEG